MTTTLPLEPADDGACAGARAWPTIKAEMKQAFGDDIYECWFHQLEYCGMNGSVVELSTPTQFIRHWCKTTYGRDILSRWQSALPEVTEVRFKVRSQGKTADVARSSSAPQLAGGPQTAAAALHKSTDAPVAPANQAAGFDGSPLDQRMTFATFVEGSSNALAVAAAKKAAGQKPGERAAYNPLFVSASVGLGKTHLLQAIASEAVAQTPSRRVLYLTAEHFMYRFVSAIRQRTAIAFKDVLRDIDLLLIDDLQFLNGQKVHEEFCHTLTTLVDNHKQVVIAADRAPNDLEGLEARVRSRLGGGLLVELEAPDYAMRRKILELRIAAQREVFPDLAFPDHVVDFVARSVTTSGRDLEGAVNRLVAHNQLTNAPIDEKMAENALRDLLKARESRKPKIEDIQRVTSQHFNVSKHDLVSARRTRVIVRPRQIAMYLCKVLTPRSLPEIGKRFGNRDHTTVLHAVRKIEELIGTDAQLAEDVETLKRLLDQ